MAWRGWPSTSQLWLFIKARCYYADTEWVTFFAVMWRPSFEFNRKNKSLKIYQSRCEWVECGRCSSVGRTIINTNRVHSSWRYLVAICQTCLKENKGVSWIIISHRIKWMLNFFHINESFCISQYSVSIEVSVATFPSWIISCDAFGPRLISRSEGWSTVATK